MKMKGTIDEVDFIGEEDIGKAYKIIERRIGKLKKEGKIHMCSIPLEEEKPFEDVVK